MGESLVSEFRRDDVALPELAGVPELRGPEEGEVIFREGQSGMILLLLHGQEPIPISRDSAARLSIWLSKVLNRW